MDLIEMLAPASDRFSCSGISDRQETEERCATGEGVSTAATNMGYTKNSPVA